MSRDGSLGTGIDNDVRIRRVDLGMTQQELADKLSVTRQTVISIEKCKYTPSLRLAIKLSDILGKRIEELFRP